MTSGLDKRKMAYAILRMSNKQKISSRQYDLGRKIASNALTDLTVYEWYHSKHGTIKATCKQLCDKFNLKSSSNLFKVAHGELIKSSGWMLKQNSTISYATLRRSKMKLSESSTKIYHWWNNKVGVVESSAFDLAMTYDNLRGKSGYLLEVAYEKRYEYRGWRLKKNKDLDIQLAVRQNRIKGCKKRSYSCSDQNVYKWIHPLHGIVEASIDELIKKFPHELMKRSSSLLKVTRGPKNGGQQSCKKWKIYEC
jgi:hypothetical protein